MPSRRRAGRKALWRGILDYFAPALQIGLTATPKREINTDTYAYFGEPAYIYSLKEGINDGYLTDLSAVKQIAMTLDDYYLYARRSDYRRRGGWRRR